MQIFLAGSTEPIRVPSHNVHGNPDLLVTQPQQTHIFIRSCNHKRKRGKRRLAIA